MRILVFLWLLFLPLCSVLFRIDIAWVSGECLGGLRLCLEDEKSLLLQLKDSLTFKPNVSVKLVSWNESVDCCSWGGVTWDSNGLAVSLDLSSELISGGFNSSSTLFSLQHLQRLNLANNSFNSSQIPSGFDKLGNLTYLNLSDGGFSGQIPIEISHLTRLAIIDLSSISYLTGIPKLKLENPNLRMLVQNLTQLRELYLNGVNISAQGKEWCRALSSSVPNLQVLSLPNCYLSGPLDSSLQKLRSLSSIRLDSNNFSAPVLEFLANFSNLTQLKLSSCGLKGTFPEKIFQVPTLQILDLSNNRLLEGSLPVFPQNGSLETLVLSNTKFSGKVPISVSNLKRLTRIELADCNFRGSIPNSMANLTQLVYMDLSGMRQILSSHWFGLENLVTLDLRNNSLNGSLPMRLFSLSSLQKIQLSNNQFSGPFSEFEVKSFSVLDTLDLSSNNLEGPIPVSVFDLKRLNILDLSSNKFNGTVELSSFQKLGNLTNLSLSYNNLSINASVGNPTLPLLPNLTTLKLASCKLRTLPNLSTQSKLTHLDLSDNQIPGSIPNWIWKIGNGSLMHLNLSHNLLKDLQVTFSNFTPDLSILDLHSNQLHGQIPTPPQFSSYVDYSNNSFNSSIPYDIGTYLSFTIFFSLSKNNITGSIPRSICNATYLQVLDLSDNNLSGKVPSCLIEYGTLGVLNLRRNNFSGAIPGKFPVNCLLQTLDLSGNRIEGKIPGSLANCTALEVLNLGNNQMNDTFPCLLKNITTLRVLVLRGNKFQGSIGCPKSNSTWAMLQIVDLAFNNFSGKLPTTCFSTWTAMMAGENEVQSKLKHLQFRVLQFSQLYYQDAVTVTSKGLEMELVKVLTLYTSIDLSCNNFDGEIPEVMGNFTALYVLNLSHNSFTGQIPSTIGNLRQLESLDLSRNGLRGEIPTQLSNLNFLSVLDLSFNQLVGRIPAGSQMQTFSETSYEGNKGLCGWPLNLSCTDPPPSQDKRFQHKEEFHWEFIITGLGFGVGAGIIVAPLIFWKKGRKWLDECVDRFVLLILPIVRLLYTNYGRVEAEEAFGIELTDITGGYEDSDEEKDEIEFGSFDVRFCVFCTKLDIGMKKPIHNPNCSCHDSPPILSSSSSSSSSSSQI
ncbi:Receptor like protein 42 [Vitis vinifera]|uniref:Receptor like protein 42 n=1 Tax=Vitis vinifera TaxID=29760 RepID=A0A438BRS4_VITVI|nr:Receptor like protein 42 [Vitis vinifera]